MTMAVRLSVEPKFSRFHAFYGTLVKYSVGAPNRKFWMRYCLTINSYDLFAGRLKWSDIKQLLIYLTGLSWRLVCLVRYLNPVHYAWARMRAPSFRHVDLQGVYYPAFKERVRSYFKSGQCSELYY